MEARRRTFAPGSTTTATDSDWSNTTEKSNDATITLDRSISISCCLCRTGRRERASRMSLLALVSFSLALVVIRVLFSQYETYTYDGSILGLSSAGLSVDLGNHPNQSPPPKTVGHCTNLKYSSSNILHKPVWIASFPGSGSEMVRDLVQALTGGLVGGSVYVKRDPPYQDCVSSKSATCKTHWPLLPIHSPLENREQYNSNCILLIRNPIAAFPSRLNHLWEVRTDTGAHTTQAPEKAWNQWIKKSWKQQVEKYQELIQTWTNATFPYDISLVLAYEELVPKIPSTNNASRGSALIATDGAVAAKRLVQVLQDANARVVVGDESIECLWKHVVVDQPRKKRSQHAYTPGYTPKLKERIRTMIRSGLLGPLLREEQRSDSLISTSQNEVRNDLIRFLQIYAARIDQDIRIIEA